MAQFGPPSPRQANTGSNLVKAHPSAHSEGMMWFSTALYGSIHCRCVRRRNPRHPLHQIGRNAARLQRKSSNTGTHSSTSKVHRIRLPLYASSPSSFPPIYQVGSIRGFPTYRAAFNGPLTKSLKDQRQQGSQQICCLRRLGRSLQWCSHRVCPLSTPTAWDRF